MLGDAIDQEGEVQIYQSSDVCVEAAETIIITETEVNPRDTDDEEKPLVTLPAAPYTRYALCGASGDGKTSELKQQWLQKFGSAMVKWSQDFMSIVDTLPRTVQRVRMVKKSIGYSDEIERVVPILFHTGGLDKPVCFNSNGIIVCYGVGDCNYAGDGILIRSGSGRTTHIGSGIIIKNGSGPCTLLNNGIVINFGTGCLSNMPSAGGLNNLFKNNCHKSYSSNFQNCLLYQPDPRPPVIICEGSLRTSLQINSNLSDGCVTIFTDVVNPSNEAAIQAGCCKFIPSSKCNLAVTRSASGSNSNSLNNQVCEKTNFQIKLSSSPQHQIWKNYQVELFLSKQTGIQIEDINNCTYTLTSEEEVLCVAGFSMNLQCAIKHGQIMGYLIRVDTSEFQKNSFTAVKSSHNCITLNARHNSENLHLLFKVEFLMTPFMRKITSSSDHIRISHDDGHALIQICF